MSNNESKLTSLIRPADHDNADRLERLHNYRIDPQRCKLTEREMKHYNRLRYAMLLSLDAKKGKTLIIRELQNDLGIKYSTAKTLLSQIPAVYPDLIENSVEIEKSDMVARLYRAMDRCESRDTVEDDIAVTRIAKEIREVKQWGKEDFGIKEGDIQIPLPIWTDDASVLDADKGSDTPEDIEYELIDSDEGTDDEEGDDEDE